MTVLITLTIAGADSGPFNLYSDFDGYVSAFETGISKSSLLAGYSSAVVPDGTNSIRVKSMGVCVNFIDIVLETTTTTTTTEIPPTLESGAYSSSFLASPTLGCDLVIDTNCWIDTASPGTITLGDIAYTDIGGTTPIVGGNQYYKMSLVDSYVVFIDNLGVLSVDTICDP